MNSMEVTSMPLIQEWLPQDEGEALARDIDPNLERRAPMIAEKKRMDRELIALGNLFKDSGIWWQIDGGLNISITRGDYIGVHKDIDVSFQRKDIPKLEQLLAQRGYGLFLYQATTDRTEAHHPILRRVGAEGFRKTGYWRYIIHSIDDTGTIRQTDQLSWLDVHIVERDEQGRPFYEEYEQTIMPEEWLTTRAVQCHNVPLRLSHPARFLYFKMFFGRAYDEQDIEKYVALGAVTLHDLDTVENVLQQNFHAFEQRKILISELAPSIAKIIANTQDTEKITQQLWNYRKLQELLATYGHRAKDPEWIRSRVTQFVDRVRSLEDQSAENIEKLLLKPSNTDMGDLETRTKRRLKKIRDILNQQKS